MCGRFTLGTDPRSVQDEFDVPEVPEGVIPRYNIAPTQAVLVIRGLPDARRECVAMRWGLVPSWAEDLAIGNRMINARAETAAQKPSFRSAMKSRRCLIPADGFYEWAKQKGTVKQPYYIHRHDGKPFAFAGLWEKWSKGAEPVLSCTILTTDANELMLPIHERMPVIVAHGDYGRWLDPQQKDPAPLLDLLRPARPEGFEATMVSRWVNDPHHEDPRCREPVGLPLD
jgi:putative SOS response-associated peptidase YedK